MKAFKRNNQQFIILALNTENDDFVWQHLDIKPLKELTGCYKGVKERSYLLKYEGLEQLMVARCFNQESVLLIDKLENGHRKASVFNLKLLRSVLDGDWTNAGSEMPHTNAWTLDNETGDYYVMS